MCDDKKITIIIPVYNAAEYLPYCLGSILGQTYRNLEVILVDDGSPDNSGEICDAYARDDARVTVIHKENGGQCSARNAGLAVATGELLMFIDSDDFVDNDICRRLYDIMCDTGAELVRCGFLRFSEYGKPIDRGTDSTGEVSVFSTQQAFENFVRAPYSNRKPFIPMVCAALYRRELFDDIPFPEGKIYEEGFVLPKVFLRCKTLAFLDEPLYLYYCNSDGTMASGFTDRGLKSIDDWREIHFLIYDRFPSLRADTAERWINKYILTYTALAQRNDIDSDGAYKKHIRDGLKEYEPHFRQFAGKELMTALRKFNTSPEDYDRYIKRRQRTARVTELFGAVRSKIIGGRAK